MKILNLYAGIGGNRKHWKNCEVTAIENNPEIANIYKHFFKDDNVIVTDAHEYLLNHFKEFDFIWSSPPCQSHSSIRQNLCVRFRGTKPVFPDMKLYQEIIFLRYNFTGKWIVENVKPYYTPLIKPDFSLQRHYFWGNFEVHKKFFESTHIVKSNTKELEEKYNFDLSNFKVKNKKQILNNCVTPEIGNYIFEHIQTA